MVAGKLFDKLMTEKKSTIRQADIRVRDVHVHEAILMLHAWIGFLFTVIE